MILVKQHPENFVRRVWCVDMGELDHQIATPVIDRCHSFGPDAKGLWFDHPFQLSKKGLGQVTSDRF
ncbi:hypothetical protein D3C87_2018570 [compost metagenome]